MDYGSKLEKERAQESRDNAIKDVCKAVSDEAVAVIRATFKAAAMRKEGQKDIALEFEKIRLNAALNVQTLVTKLSDLLTEDTSAGE